MVGAELSPAITALLRRRGIEYEPVGPTNSPLWCLGGPELYRNPDEVDDITPETCLDLNLRVCDEHHAISLELYPYDLVPESGGSGPEDPRRSTPIDLQEDQTIVDQVLLRAEAWLDEVLVLPK